MKTLFNKAVSRYNHLDQDGRVGFWLVSMMPIAVYCTYAYPA